MNSPEVHQKISVALSGSNNSFYGKKHSEQTRQVLAAKFRLRFQNNPEYRRKLLEASHKGWRKMTRELQRYRSAGLPNPSERGLEYILNRVAPGGFQYNNGWFVLGGKIPDFVAVDGQKKLVELFGEAYHTLDEEPERVDYFAQLGWQTLVVWASELKLPQTVDKVSVFVNRGDSLCA